MHLTTGPWWGSEIGGPAQGQGAPFAIIVPLPIKPLLWEIGIDKMLFLVYLIFTQTFSYLKL